MCDGHVTESNWSPSWLRWQITQRLNLSNRGSVHLDLGSGKRPANPFRADKVYASDINTISESDLSEFGFVQIQDLVKIPLPSSSLDSISAFDLLEHIPRDWPNTDGGVRYPFIELMNEISRLLKPGGIFMAVTPAFPSPAAFQDPTHINFISEQTIHYFDEKSWASELGYGYVGTLTLVHQSWLRGAGPYLGRKDKVSMTAKYDSASSVKMNMRYLNRTIRLLTFKKPMSLLWVLRKPCLK